MDSCEILNEKKGAGASVNWQFNFQRLPNLSNHRKPPETWEPGNLATYVQFPGNQLREQATATMETMETTETWKLRRKLVTR